MKIKTVTSKELEDNKIYGVDGCCTCCGLDVSQPSLDLKEGKDFVYEMYEDKSDAWVICMNCFEKLSEEMVQSWIDKNK